MDLTDELGRIAEAAAVNAAPGERVTGIVAAETLTAGRVYLCAYESGDRRAWLALGTEGKPVTARETVREASQIAALCEIAEESAGGGDLPALRVRLAELRDVEHPAGIEEAEDAATALAGLLERQPRIASADYLDRLGAAARRLEQALGDDAGSPFALAMQQAGPAVEELAADVERNYKGPLA
jgi:hypothetical protein